MPSSVSSNFDDSEEIEIGLVARIRAGDERAMEELYRATYPALLLHATRVAGSRALAEDIVHDVFCSLWDRRGSMVVQQPLPHYLHRAVHYRALNARRRERVEDRYRDASTRDEVPRVIDGDAVITEREHAAAVARAVAELPERAREVFVLSRRGLTYAQIGRQMRISVKTVEGQMTRALRSLRKSLAGLLT